MAVYIIQAGGADGPVKIGSTNDVYRRLAMLQTGSPEKLRLLHTFGGGADDERRLQKTFSKHRHRGEWFLPHDDIIAGNVGLLPIDPTQTSQRKPGAENRGNGWTESSRKSSREKCAARWADPVWSSKNREKIQANRINLRINNRQNWLRHYAKSSAILAARGACPLTNWSERQLPKYLAELSEMIGMPTHEIRAKVGDGSSFYDFRIPRHELRPDLWEAPSPAEASA